MFEVYFGSIDLSVIDDNHHFPLNWTHECVSLDPGPGDGEMKIVSGILRLAVTGQVQEEGVHQEAWEEDQMPTDI